MKEVIIRMDFSRQLGRDTSNTKHTNTGTNKKKEKEVISSKAQPINYIPREKWHRYPPNCHLADKK